ncbi:zinc finger protein 687-like [Ylistrum balloti]|uniref:zinc finger protein 687-like n=1 Tax=Ylistrum balloti TaxID=509963 RepID=UPI00290593FE|nr:zinc finger protein 687-like [Ylistrum balloti]
MGSVNIAEISVDANSGLISIHSRHKLELNHSKVMGAVAILLVEPTNATDGSSTSTGVNSASTLSRGCHKDDVISIEDTHSGGTGHGTRIVPSSVSLISSPCGWVGGEGFGRAATCHAYENGPQTALDQEHDVLNTAHNKTRSHDNTVARNDRNMDQESLHYFRSSTDNSGDGLYDQNKTKRTEYKSSREETLPTKNVSVIDLTDVSVRQQQNKHNTHTPAATPSGNLYRKQSSSGTFIRPNREPRVSLHSKTTQLVHAPRLGSPFLSRVNSQLQRRKHRNTKISKLVQQPTNQRANDAKCCVCAEVLTSFADNQSHSIKHDLQNQCVVCGIKLSVTSNLRRHFLGHIHNIAFTCPFCTAMYRRKDNLTSHLFQKHNINSMQRRSQQLIARMGKVPKQIQGIDDTSQSSAHNISERQDVVEVTSDPPNSGNENVVSTASRSAESPMLIPMETNVPSELQQLVTRIPDSSAKEVGQSNQSPIQIKDEPEGNSGSSDFCSAPQVMHGNQQVERDQTESTDLYSSGGIQESNDILTTDAAHQINTSSILNYSCSTCDVKFPQLEKLQDHVAAFHSDQVPTCVADSDTGTTNGHTLVSTTDSTVLSVSAEGQALYLYSETRGSETSLEQENIRMAMSSGNKQHEEVIDIENLSDMSNFQHTESTLMQQAGYSSNRQGDILAKATDFLGSVYSSFIPPSYESSPSSNMNQSMESPNTSFSPGRNRISKGNNKCLVCGLLLSTWEAIMEHGEQHASVLSNQYGPGKRFPCVVCQTPLSTKDSLRRHAVNHMGVQHFCTMCSAVYSRRDNLLKHMRDTHGVHTPRA